MFVRQRPPNKGDYMSTEINLNDLSFEVSIPSAVLLNPNINDSCVKLFAFIKGLTRAHGYCYATNEYLAKCMNTSTSSLKRWLKQLKDEGCIEIVTDKEGIHWQRHIYLGVNLKKCLRRSTGKLTTAQVCADYSSQLSYRLDIDNKYIENNTKVREGSRTKEISPEIESLKKKIYETIIAKKPNFRGTICPSWHLPCKKLLKDRKEEDILKALNWALDDKKFWNAIILSPQSLEKHLDQIELKMQSNPTIEDHESRIQRHKEQAMKYHDKLWRGERVEARENSVEFYMGNTFRASISYAEKEEKWIELTGMKINDNP